jgi:hypothetical protein
MRWGSRLTKPNKRLRWSKLWRALSPLFLATLAGAQPAKPAVPAGTALESVLPSLAYGPSCSSTVVLQNLAETPVDVELEGHRSSGALAPLAGRAGRVIHLVPGERGSFQLLIQEEDRGAWVHVRERAAPAVAVSGTTECREGNQLRTAARQVAYPTRNPWFAGDVAELHGSVISLINVSAAAVRASLCYSSGSLFSVPGDTQASRELRPVCSTAFEVQVPPFGTRDFPVEREGSSYFAVKTWGDSIVLQMLRPAKEGVRLYTVDSTIKFGAEVPQGHGH